MIVHEETTFGTLRLGALFVTRDKVVAFKSNIRSMWGDLLCVRIDTGDVVSFEDSAPVRELEITEIAFALRCL